MSSDHITETLNEILRRTGLIETGIKNLGTRLEVLESDQRFELILEHIKEMREELNNRIAAVENELKELRPDMEKGFRRLEHKVALQNKNISEMYADIKEVEDRVDNLEKEPA